jgi:hypothetical protein
MSSSLAASSSKTASVKQATLDEEALQAIVEATECFSDADLLAQASNQQYGDVRNTHKQSS